ncbi:MAG: zf-HC2 domain-containing protein [Clostridia bacterium]|nr:zf-HC2 domain-containing protein [Clostridia bacterium]
MADQEQIISCNIIQDLMPLVIDNACSEETRQAVDDHVRSCPSCGQVFSAMKARIPALPVDENAEKNIRQAMKKTKRKTLWLKVLAACLGVIVLISGIYAAANPEVLFYAQTSAPASWFIGAHLARTQEGALLVQFTPDAQMKDFYGFRYFHHQDRSVSIANARIQNTAPVGTASLEFSYSWLARLLNLKKPAVDRTHSDIIPLPNGDWAVPLCSFVDIRYVDGQLLGANWRPLTFEEIKAQVEQDKKISGNALIFDYEKEVTFVIRSGSQVTEETAQNPTYETCKWIITGGGQTKQIYQPGEDIPLCDEETEQLFQQWRMKHAFDFPAIGTITPDENL